MPSVRAMAVRKIWQTRLYTLRSINRFQNNRFPQSNGLWLREMQTAKFTPFHIMGLMMPILICNMALQAGATSLAKCRAGKTYLQVRRGLAWAAFWSTLRRATNVRIRGCPILAKHLSQDASIRQNNRAKFERWRKGSARFQNFRQHSKQ